MTNTNTSAVDTERIAYITDRLMTYPWSIAPEAVALINALLAERPQWRDIADAPKDGTGVLAFWNWGNGGITGLNYHVVSWFSKEDGDTGHWCCVDTRDEFVTPHYWMPLPAPPVSRQQDGTT